MTEPGKKATLIDQFADDLENLVGRYREREQLRLGEVLGVFDVMKTDMMFEQMESPEAEDLENKISSLIGLVNGNAHGISDNAVAIKRIKNILKNLNNRIHALERVVADLQIMVFKQSDGDK